MVLPVATKNMHISVSAILHSMPWIYVYGCILKGKNSLLCLGKGEYYKRLLGSRDGMGVGKGRGLLLALDSM